MKEEFFSHDDSKPKLKKLTDEENKVKQRAYAKAWYERKKAGKDKVKKQNPKAWKKKSPLNAEHSSFTFLFFTHDDEEYTEVVLEDKAPGRAREIFADPDYHNLQQIYFMKPLKLFNRPVMEIIEL